MAKKITLILGGIRSGKSHFAEQKALNYDDKPIYIATATSCACDKEMNDRISLHRERRGNKFETIEAPYDITGPLLRLKNRTVLVDCMTLNLSNRLMATEEYLDMQELILSDEEYLQDLYDIITKNKLNVIFVSNEVGYAPVEMNQLGRYFQDLQGRWNRIIADYADEVYSIQAGIPNLIKKNDLFPFRISAPSYVLPTGYIENVTYLLDKVDDIQLLAFDSLPDDPLFKENTLTTLQYLARESGTSFSVHMPVKPKVFDEEEKKLSHAIDIIAKLSDLNITSFTFHYDLPDGKTWKKLSTRARKEIENRYISFFKQLKAQCSDVDISLENVETPLVALDNVIKECEISYAIDIGHLSVQNWPLEEVKTRLPQASIVHLHGWEMQKGKRQDHRALGYDKEIFKLIEDYRGVLTIENYHPLLLNQSLSLLKEYF